MITKLRDHMIEAKLLKDERLTRLGFLVLAGVIVLLISDVLYLNSIIIQLKELKADSFSRREESQPQYSLPPSLPSQSPTNSPTITLIPTESVKQSNTMQTSSLVHDYFIPLGTGSSSSNTWQSIEGALATIDFGGYSNIDKAYFEVSASNPSSDQIIWIRLYNQTDGHEVWNSEVLMSGNTNKYLVSAPISWEPGLKTYQVQMKTQLQSVASFSQSRIHILTK